MDNLPLTYEFIQTKAAELASILGFLLTIAVLIYSRSIRASVEEGRRELLHRLEQEEMLEQYSRLVGLADRCLDNVENANWDLAEHLLMETLKDLSYFVNRWRDQIRESYTDLIDCHKKLDSVRCQLSRKPKGSLQIVQCTVIVLKETEAKLCRRKEEFYVPTKG